MKPHKFLYRVYTPSGNKIFESTRRDDALVWCDGNENHIVRKDLLGNYPDTTL